MAVNDGSSQPELLWRQAWLVQERSPAPLDGPGIGAAPQACVHKQPRGHAAFRQPAFHLPAH